MVPDGGLRQSRQVYPALRPQSRDLTTRSDLSLMMRGGAETDAEPDFSALVTVDVWEIRGLAVVPSYQFYPVGRANFSK